MTLPAFSLSRPLILYSTRRASPFGRPSHCSRSRAFTTTMTATTSFDRLSDLCKEISDLSGISGILGWDEQVMMPSGAASSRGRQKAALAAVLHDKSTSDTLANAITEAKKDAEQLGPFEKATIRDAEREYKLAVGVPKELEKQIALQEVASVQSWIEARKNNDLSSYLPVLEKTLDLMKQKVKAMNPSIEPYDGLIDQFERGMSAQRLSEIFDQISTPLKDLLEKTLKAKEECTRSVHPALTGGEEWTIEKQTELCKDICDALGFNFDKGRIDVSVHPFTGGACPDDVRITTRYSTDNPFEGIMGTVHEVGHAMYEQGRNAKYDGLPVSNALSMGAHESQSLFWERMVGQNFGFWKAMLPKIHERLPHTKDVTADDLFFAVNQVKRSLIRVDADELTYAFHIILRFELEKKLMNGSLDMEDISKAWNEGMKKHLGIEPSNDAEGCLQDVHWPSGAFGYFPSYSLGAMTAAQIFGFMKREGMPDIDEKIEAGQYSEIRDWLKTEIHEKGSLYPSLDSLLEHVTGEPLNPEYFLGYLEEKYSEVYE